MALTKKAHKVRLLNFEEELLTQLSEKTGKSEEQLLLQYIRAGLKREKFEDVESYSKREKNAKAQLYEERVQVLYGTSTTSSSKNQNGSATADAVGSTEIADSQPAIESEPTIEGQQSLLPESSTLAAETTLDQQFDDLSEAFALVEPSIDQISAGQHYLLKGKKQLRIILIDQVQEDGNVYYQIEGETMEKPHSILSKHFAEKARGAIAQSQIAVLQARLLA